MKEWSTIKSRRLGYYNMALCLKYNSNNNNNKKKK